MKSPNCLTQAPKSLLSCAALAVEKLGPSTALAKESKRPDSLTVLRVTTVRSTRNDPFLLIFELPRVAGRAGHAELARFALYDEADRQTFDVFRTIVAQIAIALELLRGERLVDFGLSQRLEPCIRDHSRPLARAVERVAVRGRPALGDHAPGSPSAP